MVNFETQVYHRESNTIIGAEVIVYADTGERIGNIIITNETDYDDLVDRIDGLSSECVTFDDGSSLTGETIDTILANVSEAATINATKLGGFQSDQYTKTGHTHSKNSITDLYNYDISLSDYNPVIGTEVTVTVRVSKQNNSNVANQSVVITKDGATWKTGNTNSNGIYTAKFTPTEEGIVTFGVANQKVQFMAKVSNTWKTLYSSNFYTLQSKGKNMRLIVNSGTTSISTPTSYTLKHTFSSSLSSYMPAENIGVMGQSKVSYVLQPNGKLFSVSMSGSTVSVPHNCMLQWVL